MTRRRAFYASNVFHYRHIVGALQSVADDVTLAARFEVSEDLVRRARTFRVPNKAVSLLERRVIEDQLPVARVGLGPGQFLLPLMARVDRLNTLSVLRRAIDMESQAVARRVPGHDIFWFMEGLGHRALAKSRFELAVCERRHFHHEVLEGDPGVVGDFPFRFRPDPIGDMLNAEYEQADLISVYSQVARQSFLDRGFDPNKVVVTPLGFPQLTFEDGHEARNPHVIAYVGRCDAFKGIDVAVAAVKALGAPFRLEVAGPAADYVRGWLAQQRHVDYRGILGLNDLTELYRRAGALISPSIESFGYAALEGAAHGAPLICSTFTGAREFLPPGSCTVVDGREPEEWASAIVMAMRRSPDINDIRSALESLSWQRSAESAERLLRAHLR